MNVVGIIAEYNPFHKGHFYHIEEAKKRAGADYCIVVMSGDFVQRGEPAYFSKYTRARMALRCGADLVIELPNLFAVSSAEDFASCGVRLLNSLGVVTHLCFGSETEHIEVLLKAARLLSHETEEFSISLKEGLNSGLTWPQARNRSLLQTSALTPAEEEELTAALSSPNSLLAIEYCKALIRLESPIRPIAVRRLGEGYHDTRLDGIQASASAIRNAQNRQEAAPHIPEPILPLYDAEQPLTVSDCSDLLNYTLLTLSRGKRPFTEFADVSPELANRLERHLLTFTDWEGRIRQLKTRQYTYTRISRLLTHILLGITDSQVAAARQAGYAPYARILGFRAESRPLLSAIKAASAIPMITKTADGSAILEGTALELFTQDLYASHIRRSLESLHSRSPLKNEYLQPVSIL